MSVRDLLGAPSALRHYEFSGTKLDQLIFERPHEPVTSIFFVEDRVVTKSLGSSIPADIFDVVVPDAPDPGDCDEGINGAVIGASESDMLALFGKPEFKVEYRFNGQRAAHVIYRTRDRHTLGVHFVGGALIEMTDFGEWSMDDITGG
jgi:hypothetical protein